MRQHLRNLKELYFQYCDRYAFKYWWKKVYWNPRRWPCLAIDCLEQNGWKIYHSQTTNLPPFIDEFRVYELTECARLFCTNVLGDWRINQGNYFDSDNELVPILERISFIEERDKSRLKEIWCGSRQFIRRRQTQLAEISVEDASGILSI